MGLCGCSGFVSGGGGCHGPRSMKAPKCPKCGKEHYSTQRCSAKGSQSSPPSRIEVGGSSAHSGGTGRKSPDDIGRASEEKAGLTAALTPAEKQKAYRKRHKDRVREADRLRKRMQRESDSDSD